MERRLCFGRGIDQAGLRRASAPVIWILWDCFGVCSGHRTDITWERTGHMPTDRPGDPPRLTSSHGLCHHLPMQQAETKALVMAAWDRWCRANLPASDRLPSGNDAFKFCGYLKSEQPDLLRFRSRRDAWQVVHGWLLSSGKVRD